MLAEWEVEDEDLQRLLLPRRSTSDLRAIPIPPNVPDPRGVELATLFCHSCLVMAAQLLGMGRRVVLQLLLVENFDGKLFQWLYLEARHPNHQ